MSLLNTDLPTLADQAKRMDPNGGIARIVEQLSKRNPLLEDAVFLEGNQPTGHIFTSRTALPAVGFRRFNEGVAPSKSRTDQVTESCGMMSAFSVVDCALARLNGNEAAFRASEDIAFMQAMNNEAETGYFYHSTKTAPEKFMGFSPRMDSTTGPGGSNIIKCEAAAAGNDQASIWLIVWGPETVHGIFPKGSVAGLQHEDMGKQLWDDGSGKKFKAYVTSWDWQLGLCVRDWRYVARIANIDTSSINVATDTIVDAMIDALGAVQDLKSGRPVFYMNRKVATLLRKQAKNATKNSTLSIDQVGGRSILSMDGVPCRQTDALLNSEAVVA